MKRSKLLLTAVAVLLPSVASAQFTFESTPVGVYSSIVSTFFGQTLTVTTTDGSFVHAADPGVPLLGSVSVIGSKHLFGPFAPFTPLRFSFSNPVSFITFAFGDEGGDNDTPARITAYDPFNTLLGVFDSPYPAGFDAGATKSLTFGGAGASFFVLSSPGGVGNDDSIYWEVTAFKLAPTVAPEPASLVLMGTGLALIGVVHRRRNKA